MSRKYQKSATILSTCQMEMKCLAVFEEAINILIIIITNIIKVIITILTQAISPPNNSAINNPWLCLFNSSSVFCS